MSDNIIGKADGPTSIFLTDNSGISWIDIIGLAIVILMLLPNIIFAVKYRSIENKCRNKIMNIIEQIGRYASMFFMIFNIGMFEYGFLSIETFVIYYLGNTILIIGYWIIWILYFKKMIFWKSMMLAIIPTAIFFISGITLRDYMLVLSAIVFGIGHIYVTYKNAKC